MTGEIQAVAGVIGDVAEALKNVPEPVRRNLFNAVGALITGIVEVPASYLEMKANAFKVQKQGHEKIMMAAAQNAAGVAGQSPELEERALSYFAHDLVKGQANREGVAREAFQAAKALPPLNNVAETDEATPEIDEDWLDQFRKLASSKSSADIQAILGRILAGEAQKPGSFAPMTLDVIFKLDKVTAQGFEKFASYAITLPDRSGIIVNSIIGEDMVRLDYLLNYMAMRHLQAHGLLLASTGQSINREYFASLPPSTLGGQVITFSSMKEQAGTYSFMPPINGEAWSLSLAGMQLLPLLPKTLDLTYARRLRDGMRRLNVTLTFPNIDIDASISPPVPT